MRLALKFNLILAMVCGLGFSATAFIAHSFLFSNAQSEVVRQARLMMATSLASRDYTAQHIQHLLGELHTEKNVFYPEYVPAYAATTVFQNLRQKYPDYSYREATLNPTNPSDRATDWEADVINIFRNDPAKTEFIGERDAPSGRVLFLARPLKVSQECMTCHSLSDAAPVPMVQLYGKNNGYGWKMGEVVAAQIVSVPMAIPQALATRAFWILILSLAGVAAVSFILFNAALFWGVILPVQRLSATADEISRGNLHIPELPVKGKDEISLLADAFNRMHRSLVKAMKLIGE